MNDFQLWVLNILEQIPELNLYIPDFAYQFLKDAISLMNCFVVFKDFVPILSASVFISSIMLSMSLLDYIRSYKR